MLLVSLVTVLNFTACGGTASSGASGSSVDQAGERALASNCASAKDCRLFDNYCGSCACDALSAKAPDPKCDKANVACLVQPCGNKMAVCSNGKCAVRQRRAGKPLGRRARGLTR